MHALLHSVPPALQQAITDPHLRVSWTLTSKSGSVETIHKKKKCKKAKWLSEEDLQIAEKRREAKGKGDKERYIHLNAEFQRRARRDQKAFLS